MLGWCIGLLIEDYSKGNFCGPRSTYFGNSQNVLGATRVQVPLRDRNLGSFAGCGHGLCPFLDQTELLIKAKIVIQNGSSVPFLNVCLAESVPIKYMLGFLKSKQSVALLSISFPSL